MAEKTPPGTLSIVYEEVENRPNIPVGGAFGGVSPDASMVVAHLYVEFSTIPAMSDHDIGTDGSIDLTKGHHIKRGDVTRKVVATLVMSPEVAVGFGKWMVGYGQKALERRKKEP